jgi:hypothetical protein
MCVIQIYDFVFSNNLFTSVYPEIDDKFLILLFAILKKTIEKKNMFTLDYKHTEHKNLIDMCYAYISLNIEKNIEEILENKDIIYKSIELLQVKYKIDKYDEINLKIKEYDDKRQNNNMNMNMLQDFCCPISCKLIKNPIMIPDCNEIFERSTIITQIFSQGINPYTREKLNLEMVENYNKQVNIKQKINEFIEKKNEIINSTKQFF